MCLHERCDPWPNSAYPRSDEPLEPPLPSTWASEGSRSVTTIPRASKIFVRALEFSLGTIPVPKNDVPDGHWLAALIHLETINCSAWLDHVDAQRSSVRNHVFKEQQKLSEEMTNLYKTLQSDISQLVAFSRTPSVKIPFLDYEEQLLMLERLLGEAKVIATEIRESLDMQHRIKSTQVAELAINESRSAIAGTFILVKSQYNQTVLTTCSHGACIRLHPYQSSFVHIWDERTRDQRNRSQHLGVSGDSFGVADNVRTCVDGVARFS